MDIKDRIKRAIEREGADVEKLRDLFDMVSLCEDKDERREWLLYVRSEARKIRSSDAYELIYRTYLLGGKDSFDDYMSACEFYREPQARFWWPRRKVLEGKHKIATQIQEFIDDPDALYLGFSMPPGTGKQLSDDTPILTKNGWKKHGDLVVGDEVIGIDGAFKKVEHVFPKAVQNKRVWFSNGAHIDCHENHEWVVFDRSRGEIRVLETKQIEKRVLEYGADSGHRGHRYVIQIPQHETVKGVEKELYVNPYALGAWLGDGTNTNPYITGDERDSAVIERIPYEVSSKWIHKTSGVPTYSFRGLRFDLQKYGMCHSRKRVGKFIPEEYLTASVEQRLDLLAGLIDTDGHISKPGEYVFTTVEETLRDSFCVLISTFGWRYSVMVEKPRTSTSGIDGKKECYKIRFCPDIEIPCALERKRQSPSALRRRIAITKVETVGETIGNCIQVEGGVYLCGRDLIPTHNSTMIKFLLAYIAGKYPRSANMYVSYSDGMVKMIEDSVRSILTDTDEYRHNEVFPGNGSPDMSAEYHTISYRRKGDFPTIGLVSLGGSVTGRTRANKFLVSDDLVKNAEVARSPERLEKLYADYKSTLTTRMIGDHTKEIQLGTIWSIHDPISRRKAEHEGDPRYRFIAIPVWDEDEVSNFEYEHPDRYTTEKIREIKKSLDPVDFSCLYMQKGIEKEGLAFPYDEMQYYNGVLPSDEPDNILFFCDVAFGGGDSLAMPICYVYGESAYIVDVVFDRSAKDITEPRVVGKIMQHKCKMGRFEGNNGGDLYKDDIDKMLKEKGYRCNISSKKAPTTMSKLSRIEQYSPEIKRFYFLDEKSRNAEYNKFINEVTSFTFTGKNLHDDAPDSLAGLAAYMYDGVKYVTVARRPF